MEGGLQQRLRRATGDGSPISKHRPNRRIRLPLFAPPQEISRCSQTQNPSPCVKVLTQGEGFFTRRVESLNRRVEILTQGGGASDKPLPKPQRPCPLPAPRRAARNSRETPLPLPSPKSGPCPQPPPGYRLLPQKGGVPPTVRQVRPTGMIAKRGKAQTCLTPVSREATKHQVLCTPWRVARPTRQTRTNRLAPGSEL